MIRVEKQGKFKVALHRAKSKNGLEWVRLIAADDVYLLTSDEARDLADALVDRAEVLDIAPEDRPKAKVMVL